ncbi:MFS transporter [Alicyclobacillus macrosporangiidus]|uniref:Fucose permease n=1 Tax=Alicyclobacillus macrosporangiidus TaxID=392015 RepID=A0A1I7KZE3_9BACL|nr:MFS transporter [Alicyclobacillus macrosporangiidus]SFV02656.1 Fucose permease [Alicyclobacillus macrosporangiidus]
MKRFWLPLGLFAMVVIGSYDMLRGAAAPLMQADWRLGYEQLGSVFSLGSLGYLAGTLLSGYAVQRMWVRGLVVLGATVVVVGTGVIGLAHGFWSAAAGFAIVGVGTGALEIGTNAVIPAITPSATGQSRYFNWLHGFYGIGACGLPLAAGWILQATHAWRTVYGVLGCAVLAILVLAVARGRTGMAGGTTPAGEMGMTGATSVAESGPTGESARDRTPSAAGDPAPSGAGGRRTSAATASPAATGSVPAAATRTPWRDSVLWGFMLAIGVYVMAEVGLGTWLTTYLVEARGVSLSLASLCLSGFFLTFTAGRLAAPLWLHRVAPRRALLGALGVSLLALGTSWLPGTGTVAGVVLCGVILAGFGFSILFPTLTALASHTFSAQAGRVIGLMFTAGAIGSMSTNAMIGAVASRWGIQAGFSLIWGFLLAVLMMVWWMPDVHGQKAERNGEIVSGYPVGGSAESRRDACEDVARL